MNKGIKEVEKAKIGIDRKEKMEVEICMLRLNYLSG